MHLFRVTDPFRRPSKEAARTSKEAFHPDSPSLDADGHATADQDYGRNDRGNSRQKHECDVPGLPSLIDNPSRSAGLREVRERMEHYWSNVAGGWLRAKPIIPPPVSSIQ